MLKNAVMLKILLVFCLASFSVQATNLPMPLTEDDYLPINIEQAKLGQLLFYDKLLSGNKNIACATCHHPDFGSSDGLSLGIGEGGNGIGLDRDVGYGDGKIKRRVPRHAPALWNLGAVEFKTLFHDGRISHSDLFGNGFDSPAEEFLPQGLNDIVAVQALFPITAGVEMVGNKGENELPGAIARRIDYGWTMIVERVRQVEGYSTLFIAAFEDIDQNQDIRIEHIANAISAFERHEFRADNSPFDQFLRGDQTALTDSQLAGMNAFYKDGSCAQCHQGVLQTDHRFHNLAMPFLGPGRTRRFDNKARDLGRMNETDLASDAYKFRTPSLRNVTETSPYGHNGASRSLQAMVEHHLQPLESFESYSITSALLPQSEHLAPDNLLWSDTQENIRIKRTVTALKIDLSPQELENVMQFLHALTDQTSLAGRLGIPKSVPSLLPVD